MPPHASRPLWSAALVAALVAVPGLASLVVAPAGTAQSAAASTGTLTLGWEDSGFGWAAEDDAAEAASGAAVPLDDGTVGLRVVPQEDGDTEQPYPLALQGITAHPVDERGVIGDAIGLRPGVIVDEVRGDPDATDGDEVMPEPRRLAVVGLSGSSAAAFDVDHAIDTEWSFVLPTNPADGLPADADSSGGIAYCVAVATGSVRTADDGTARGAGAQTVLTFRDRDQLQDPEPDPTEPAPTPTSLPTVTPQPTDDPSADPSPVPPADDEPTSTPTEPVPAPTSTATTGPLPVEPDDAMTCADVDGAGEAAATSVQDPTFTHGSAQDEISTQVDEDGEAYFHVPALQPAHPADEASEGMDDAAEAPVASSLTGPGLDLSDSAASSQSLGFRLTAAPQDGAVTYRNHTDGGTFADAGHAQQQMEKDQDVRVEHRWGPTRDAHATWSFSRPGVYCVAWAVDGLRAQAPAAGAPSGRSLRPDDVLRFVVGNADPASVDCTEESEDAEIPFPSDDDGTGDGDDDGSDGGSEDGSDGDSEDGSDGDDGSDDGDSGDEDQDDRETGGLDGDDRDGDGPGSRSDEDDDDEDDDDTRVVAAPASAVVCPADEQAPRQLRDGDYALLLTDDGMRMADVATEAGVPDGSSVIVGDTARRTAAAGIDDFVAPGGQYLATGSAGAPSFTWTAGGFDEAVDLEVQQTAGDGQVRVFLGEGSGVPGDGGTLTVEPESSGTLLFGFDRPGEYAVTLSDGGDREVELEFVAGDRYASAQAGTMVSTLFSACPDVSWGTDLLSAQAPEADDAGDQADDAQAQQQTSGALGGGWWGVAGAGMGLAGILMVAILIVVLRESRR